MSQLPPRPEEVPLSPCAQVTARNSTQSRFLMLPTEIRSMIYSQCLVSSWPIVVWSALYDSFSEDQNTVLKADRVAHNQEARAPHIRAVLISLLRCSRSTAADAAAVFYHKNTFCFSGDHEYYRIISWLHQIGLQNRTNLSGLEISVRPPQKAWQLPDGTRLKRRYRSTFHTRHESTPVFSPRHPHLTGPSHDNPEGEVDVINPAIETIISLFARRRHDSSIKLILNLGFALVPGIMDFGDELFRPGYLTMDLPNLVEKWCADYTSGAIEVLWRGEATREDFLPQQIAIANVGWEFFEDQEMERPWLGSCYRLGPNDEIPQIHFLLKRKSLTGPLLASHPCPSKPNAKRLYTEWQRPDGSFVIELN
ncbi:MAG: hypothetical protein LQ337_008610 [Flavoplaca oasis]|nr:MAG: hypothetical protein LQ337_008610 [Flavoplaca oasis]